MVWDDGSFSVEFEHIKNMQPVKTKCNSCGPLWYTSEVSEFAHAQFT